MLLNKLVYALKNGLGNKKFLVINFSKVSHYSQILIWLEQKQTLRRLRRSRR